MPTSIHLLAMPDLPGPAILPVLAGILQAISSFSSSSSEPPVKQACMPWMDLSTNTLKLRDPANITWLPLFRITNAGAEPVYRGQALSQLATLSSADTGFVWSNGDGSFRVQDVTTSTPAIPLFAVRTAGLVPGPSAADADAGAPLRADGSFRVAPSVYRRVFAGAQDYSIGGLPRSDVYRVGVNVRLSNTQVLVVQVGNSGTPRQTGYTSITSRGHVSNSGGEPDPTEPTRATWGFELWVPWDSIMEFAVVADLVHIGGNKWMWVSSGGSITAGRDGDNCRGTVELTGQLDFIRALPTGSPRGTFNQRASMNSGALSVWVA